jgi:hypothetical protein
VLSAASMSCQSIAVCSFVAGNYNYNTQARAPQLHREMTASGPRAA